MICFCLRERGKSIRAARAFRFALREFATISLALFAFVRARCARSAGPVMLGNARACVSGPKRGVDFVRAQITHGWFLLYASRSSDFSGLAACEILQTHGIRYSFHTENKQLRTCFTGEVVAFAGKT